MQRALPYLLALSLTLGACAGPGVQTNESEIRQGVIEQIRPTQIQSNHHTGIGALAGGAIGVGIGSLIGAGTGRDVAMVAGAIGGAIAGNDIQKKYDKPVEGQQIIVRMTNGVLVSIVQPTTPGLRAGQRVYIEGNGESARVLPQ